MCRPPIYDNSNISRKDQSVVKQNSSRKETRFGTVEVYEFGMTLDTNPATTLGPSVRLQSECQLMKPAVPVDDFETAKPFTRTLTQFHLSYYKRKEILERAGFTKSEIKEAGKKIKAARMKRAYSEYESRLTVPAYTVKRVVSRALRSVRT